jgi:hypothetical protein
MQEPTSGWFGVDDEPVVVVLTDNNMKSRIATFSTNHVPLIFPFQGGFV